jgi:aminoglycoside/choline kinase family phosphotransferase
VPPYDDALLLGEARLLVDWTLPALRGEPPDPALIADYEARWRTVLPVARSVPETLVLRDFHVDNLLALADRPGLAGCGLLDFQDAVAGPLTYDLVSLLEDARRDIDAALVATMTTRYLDAMPDLDPDAFAASWAVLAAQRHAKVIGIFTRLHRRDGKPHYLPHIPRVWRLLGAALTHPALAPVRDWFDAHVPPAQRIAPP